MPTLPELAANHAVHGVLVATNFFGINTIPIAVNEADYARMWVQAATTMAGYEAVAGSAVAATPHTSPAPPVRKDGAADSPPGSAASQNPLQGLLDALEPILKSLGIEDGVSAHDPMISNALTTAVSNFLQNFGINWNPAAGTLNGHVYDYYSNAAQPIWYLARTLELFEDFLNVAQNPSQIIPALQYIAALALFDWPTHIAQFASTLSQTAPALAAATGAAAAPAGALGGLGGLAGLPVPPEPVAAAVPASPPTPAAPTVTVAAPAVPAGVAPPASAPAPPAPPPPAGPPPPAPPPVAGQALAFPYLVGGGPGCTPRFGAGAEAKSPAGAKKKAPEPDAAAAATQAAGRARARRRRRTVSRDHEVIKVGAEASDHGVGELGFSGSAAKPGVEAAGLTRLADSFEDTARLPLLPETWRAARSNA